MIAYILFKLRFFFIFFLPMWISKLLVWGKSFEYEAKTFLVVATIGGICAYLCEGQRKGYEQAYKEKVLGVKGGSKSKEDEDSGN